MKHGGGRQQLHLRTETAANVRVSLWMRSELKGWRIITDSVTTQYTTDYFLMGSHYRNQIYGPKTTQTIS